MSVVRGVTGAVAAIRLLVAVVSVAIAGTPGDVWRVPGTPVEIADRLPTGLALVLAGVGAGLALAIAVGVARRVSTGLLALVWLVLHGAGVVGDVDAWPTVELVFVLLASLPGAPYGSVAAAGREDPAGEWRLPDGWVLTAWALYVFGHAGAGLEDVLQGDLASTEAGVLLLVLASGVWVDALRPFAWIALLVFDIAWFGWRGYDASRGTVWLHVVTFLPAWIPPSTDAATRVFYDGGCGLCHRAVRFLLAEDRDGTRFRFAPLGGATFEETLPEADRADLPDTIVAVTPGGRTLVRSRAVVYVLGRLGGLWSLVSTSLRVVPPPLADAVYDGGARIRHRVFAKPADACPVLSADLQARFDP